MSIDHVSVLTKDRPLYIVPIMVDYYTVSVNRPVKKQGSRGQGLLVTSVDISAQGVEHQFAKIIAGGANEKCV